jgi:transketolase
MRQAFIQELTNQSKNNKNIVLLTADLGYTVFEEFKSKYPKQFFNVGVAEANMIGIATGMALSGKTVFAYSIASFATLKTIEQIKNDVAVHNAHVIVVGSGSGLSYSNSGPTHHTLEDLAVLRTIPNITIFSPADPYEVRWSVEQAIKLKKPVYIRLGKKGEPLLYYKKTKLSLGKPSILSEGKDYLIISTGNMVANVVEAEKILKEKGFRGTVVSLHTIKPLDEKVLSSLLKKYKYIFTVEEHTLLGGLGSIISEIMTGYHIKNAELVKIGVPDKFTLIAGDLKFIRDQYGLNSEQIANTIFKKLKHD